MTDILDEVKSILYDRQGTYDKPENNFTRIASLWDAYINAKVDKKITPQDVAMMMILMKIAREVYEHKRDNTLDILGYTVCLEQMYENT